MSYNLRTKPEQLKNDLDIEKNIVLIDTYNIIYRAFHGNKQDLRNKNGVPTGAIYTTLGMIKGLHKRFNIHEGCAIFDGGNNFRNLIDSQYKANRKDMPDDLKLQMPHIKRGLAVLGWPILQSVNMEADDLLASIALRKAKLGYNVYIVSGDKDFRAIVSDKITIVDTMYNVYYTPEAVFEKMGVKPAQVHGYLTLLGDSADNINGIAGVGKKTASELINKYQTIDNLISNAHEIGGKVGVNIRAAIDCGLLQKCALLAALKTDIDIEHQSVDFLPKKVDENALNQFIEEFEFHSWKKPAQIPNPKIN